MKVLQNQSLLDIAVQHYGAAECAFDLAQANGLSIDVELAAGTNLTPVPSPQGEEGTQVSNVAQSNGSANSLPFGGGRGGVSTYFQNRALKPATALTGTDENGIFDQTFDFTFE